MGVIPKPMLAAALPPDALVDIDAAGARRAPGPAPSPATGPTPVPFPVGATPKVDGVRALMVAGRLVSRTLKPIPNRRLREVLEAALPDGADGELWAGPTFQACTSLVMSADRPIPPVTGGADDTRYYMFDYVSAGGLDVPYAERMRHLAAWASSTAGKRAVAAAAAAGVAVVPLLPTPIADAAALARYEADALADGFEGVMIRRMDGRYKPGRSTLREALLLKVKRFVDAEAVITGVDELVRGSTGTPGTPGGTLGALVVRLWDGHADDIANTANGEGPTFRIGTGFSAEERAALWRRRSTLPGQLVKFKYMAIGSKDAPRFPVFLGLRHPDDAGTA
jgi:DNA ligase-1